MIHFYMLLIDCNAQSEINEHPSFCVNIAICNECKTEFKLVSLLLIFF